MATVIIKQAETKVLSNSTWALECGHYHEVTITTDIAGREQKEWECDVNGEYWDLTEIGFDATDVLEDGSDDDDEDDDVAFFEGEE